VAFIAVPTVRPRSTSSSGGLTPRGFNNVISREGQFISGISTNAPKCLPKLLNIGTLKYDGRYNGVNRIYEVEVNAMYKSFLWPQRI
jgi:hypothetical protein